LRLMLVLSTKLFLQLYLYSMLNLRKLFLLNALLLFSIQTLFAQEKMVARDGFKKGYRAIQFGIGDNFRLTQFGDATFSFVKFRSETKANYLRGYFFSTFFSREDDAKSTITTIGATPEDDISFNQFAQENLNSTFRLYGGVLSYLESDSDILPHFSYGGYVGFSYNSSTSDIVQGTDGTAQFIDTIVDDNATGYFPELGLNTSFGVEYFISKNISLLAQTGLELSYSYINNDFDEVDERYVDNQLFRIINQQVGAKRHTVSLNTSGVIFGISAYF